MLSILLLGFVLGMRHATDPDHVVAVTTIVSRERSLRRAAPIGALWGLGHSVTIFVVGGALLLFGLVIPPHVGLGMELSVAVMLVLLGAVNVAAYYRRRAHGHDHSHDHEHAHTTGGRLAQLARPLVVGVVHGLAGSAAIALLVLGTIRDPLWGLAYLVIFGAGTMAGMVLITTAVAMPFAMAAQRFERLHRAIALGSGLASVAFGLFLVYRIGMVDGLFTGHVRWTPE